RGPRVDAVILCEVSRIAWLSYTSPASWSGKRHAQGAVTADSSAIPAARPNGGARSTGRDRLQSYAAGYWNADPLPQPIWTKHPGRSRKSNAVIRCWSRRSRAYEPDQRAPRQDRCAIPDALSFGSYLRHS